jgi:cysteinyl-tRNA synthetase
MRLYNTLTRRLDELPAPPAHVGMYVCGPTVYDRAHIGNARPYVVFSWLGRWLRMRGHDVTFVHNVTDVNDKIYEAAPGASAELARRATQWYLEDTDEFGLGRPDHMPLASETVDEIVALIEELVGGGHAYPVDGDVYFRVRSFPEYGQLSGQRVDDVEEQEPNPLKEDPSDFALWKATKEGEDTWWDSPWGRGRPGWHIECSAMAEKFLGPEFWLHGGGLDLVFPHHENERAQSRAAGRPFARIWMNNGLLQFTGDKMSKSVGNVATIRDVLDEYGREAALVFFLGGHWRKPIDFSVQAMEEARAQVEGFRNAFRGEDVAPEEGEWERLVARLEDDFDTPGALAVLHDWRSRRVQELLLRGLEVFGLADLAAADEAPPELVALAQRRQEARARRDFDEADRLRGEIEAAGWEARDEPDGFRLVPRP